MLDRGMRPRFGHEMPRQAPLICPEHGPTGYILEQKVHVLRRNTAVWRTADEDARGRHGCIIPCPRGHSWSIRVGLRLACPQGLEAQVQLPWRRETLVVELWELPKYGNARLQLKSIGDGMASASGLAFGRWLLCTAHHPCMGNGTRSVATPYRAI